MMFLEEVLEKKKLLVRDLKERAPLSELKKMSGEAEKRPFFQTFTKRFPEEIRIIAEVKKASPSRGILCSDLDAAGLAADYEAGGASAVSVITEETYFRGSLPYLPEVKNATCLPVLRKDFIVDEYELYQSKAWGADGVLLIGEALDTHQIGDYLALARELDLDVLFEIHSLRTYEKVAGLEGFILGINNRDLETLKVDLSVAYGILGNIPQDRPVIVESGIGDRRDVEMFAGYGVSGFLVGTSLVGSGNPAVKLKELRGCH